VSLRSSNDHRAHARSAARYALQVPTTGVMSRENPAASSEPVEILRSHPAPPLEPPLQTAPLSTNLRQTRNSGRWTSKAPSAC
jgi:hypothetical protein